MRKFAYTISVLVLSVNMLHAQDYFFSFTEGWLGKFCYEYEGDYRQFSLGQLDPGVQFDHTYVMSEISPNGESVEISEFWLTDLETTTAYVRMSTDFYGQEQLLITGSAGNLSIDTFSGRVFEYSFDNDQYEERFDYAESDTDPSLFLCSQFTEDSILFVGSQVTTGGQTVARIIKIDSEFDLVWESEDFDCGSFCRYYPEQILELTNGNVAVLLTDFFFDSPPQETRERSILLMLDPNGNELWREYPGDDEGHWIRPGAMLEVDGEILVSFTDPYFYDENDMWQTDFECTIHFEKYSLSGNLLSESNLGGEIPNGNSQVDPGVFHQVTQMQSLADGNLLISGHTGAQGILGKLDSDLNLLWYRIYRAVPFDDNPVSQHTHIFHVNPTSDGGFICAGQYESNPGELYPQGIQTAIALKVDEYGCLEPGCQLVDGLLEYQVSDVPLSVWPNPTTGELRIELPSRLSLDVRNGGRAAVEVEVVNSAAENVSGYRWRMSVHQDEAIFDFSSLTAGLYVIRLVSEYGVYSAKVIKE